MQLNLITVLNKQMAKLQNWVGQLLVFWVALQHGPQNLIEVEDDEEEEDAEEEDDKYVAPVIAPEYQLYEIIDLVDGEDDEPPTYVE